MKQLSALVICGLTYACGGEQGQLGEYVVRDSVGIRIVENNRESAETVLYTSDQPVFELGREERGTYLFGVMGAVRLSDGTIVVANSGTSELILFDAQGQHLATVGGEGQGPGEFSFIVSLAVLPGDTLLAYDLRQRRLSWFDSQGRFVTSVWVPPHPPMYQPTPIGLLDDSTVAVYQMSLEVGAEGPARIERFPETLYRYTLGRAEPESLASFPGTETVVTETSAAAQARDIYFQRGPREFGRMTAYGVARRRLFAVDTGRFEVRVFTRDGRLTAIIRRRHEPVPVTTADLQLLRDSRLEGVSDRASASLAETFAGLPDPPQTFPACEPTILFDAQGRLWLPEYHWPPDVPYLWSVFDRDGLLDATVHTPHDLRVMAVGRDFVLGVWRDEDDVEYLRLYNLVAG